MTARSASLAGLSLVLAACLKDPAPRSPEYEQARTAWLELLRTERRDACPSPTTSTREIEALLARVDPSSIDAPFAKSLQGEIQKCRDEEAARQTVLANRLAVERQRAQQAALAKPVELAPAPVPGDPPPEPVAQVRRYAPSVAPSEPPDPFAPTGIAPPPKARTSPEEAERAEQLAAKRAAREQYEKDAAESQRQVINNRYMGIRSDRVMEADGIPTCKPGGEPCTIPPDCCSASCNKQTFVCD